MAVGLLHQLVCLLVGQVVDKIVDVHVIVLLHVFGSLNDPVVFDLPLEQGVIATDTLGLGVGRVVDVNGIPLDAIHLPSGGDIPEVDKGEGASSPLSLS